MMDAATILASLALAAFFWYSANGLVKPHFEHRFVPTGVLSDMKPFRAMAAHATPTFSAGAQTVTFQ